MDFYPWEMQMQEAAPRDQARRGGGGGGGGRRGVRSGNSTPAALSLTGQKVLWEQSHGRASAAGGTDQGGRGRVHG